MVIFHSYVNVYQRVKPMTLLYRLKKQMLDEHPCGYFCGKKNVMDLTCFDLGPRPMSISSSILGLIGGGNQRRAMETCRAPSSKSLHCTTPCHILCHPFASGFLHISLCAEHFLYPTRYNHVSLIQKRAFNNSLGGLVDHQPTQLKMILGMPRGPSKGNPPRISPLMSRSLFPSALMNLELIWYGGWKKSCTSW